MTSFSRAPLLLVLGLALAAAAAPAQLPLPRLTRPAADSVPPAAPAPAPLPAPPPAPPTLAPIDIPLRAGAMEARLAEIAALARPRAATLQIERSAAEAADAVARLSRAQAQMPPSEMTRRALVDLASEWQQWDARLRAWSATLRQRSAELDTARRELDQAEALWSRTAARARSEGAAAEAVRTAEETRQHVAEQRAAVTTRVRALLAVEVTLTRAALVVDAGLRAVDEASARERRDLLHVGSPPLWSSLAYHELPRLAPTIAGRWRTSLAAARQFVTVSRGRVALHLAIAVAMLSTVLTLRRRLRRRPGVEATTVAAERWMLARPFASSMLVALLLTGVLYPRAPAALYDVLFPLSALAMLRVLPFVMPTVGQRIGRRVVALFLVDRIVGVMVSGTPWHRLAILGVAIAALALAVDTLRRLSAADDAERRRPLLRWSARGALVATGLAGTAIASNLIGAVELAEICTSAVTSLSYLAVVGVVAAQVIDGVIAMLIGAASADVRVIGRHGPAILHGATRLVRIAAVGGWIFIALGAFSAWDPVRDFVLGMLGERFTIGRATLSLGVVLLFFGTVWLGALIGRWVALVLEQDVLDRLDLPRGVPVTIASIVRYALTAIGFFVALAAVGVDVSQLAIIGGALSVGVGFGLQTIVNNFISGLILAFERPLAIGDVVQLGALEGEVRSIGIRASVIRTFQGADVVVPNGQLLDRELINWTRSDWVRRLDVPVGVAYGSDVRAVVELLPRIAAAHAGVCRQPAPLCLFQAFGDSSLDFVLRFWTEAPDFPVVLSDVRVAVHDALAAAGIEIPFPQRDLHLRSVGPEVRASLGAPSADGAAAEGDSREVPGYSPMLEAPAARQGRER